MLEGLGKFMVARHGHGSQDEGTNGLYFVDANISRLKVATLMDIGQPIVL